MSVTLRSAAIIAAVVVLDRATKLYILSHVSFWDVYPVIAGIFNIVHAENAGAAFSMLADAPIWVRKFVLVGISMLVMAFIGVILWRPAYRSALHSSVMVTGLSLVFGGALGNLIDRVFRGTVTDFVQVFIGSYEFPSFNVADSAITIGAALLILDLLRSRKTAEH